jgi:hypothetical protein
MNLTTKLRNHVLIEKGVSSGSTVVEHMSHHPGHDFSFATFFYIFLQQNLQFVLKQWNSAP